MSIEEILTAAGITHRQGRFAKPPEGTYAVWFDDVELSGADPLPTGSYPVKVRHHSVTVELYESTPDSHAELCLEKAMTDAGLDWDKQDRVWLETEQVYEAAYDLEYTDKRPEILPPL